VSINISQIFVRYPDEKDVAALLAAQQDRAPGSPSFLVAAPARFGCAGDNAPSPTPRSTCRARWKAPACGSAWREPRRQPPYPLRPGREEKVLQPPEIFQPDGDRRSCPPTATSSRSFYTKLRGLGIPQNTSTSSWRRSALGRRSVAHRRGMIRTGNVEQFLHWCRGAA
jgi:hypothetical protein